MIKQFCNGNFIRFNHRKKKFELYCGNMVAKNGIVACFTKKRLNNVLTIDLQNQIVMPSFINAHIHLGETLFRPLPHKMTLTSYLAFTEQKNKEWADQKQTMWDHSALQTISESIESGVFALSTIRGNHILKKFPIKSYCGYPVMKSEKLSSFYHSGFEAFQLFCADCFANHITPGVFFHSFYANDKDSFLFSIRCFKHCKTFFAVHVGEDEETERQVAALWGKSSIQLLKANNLLTKNTFIIHGATLSDAELELLSQNNASLVICPTSSINLKSKYKNPATLIAKKVNWCLASDGLATGESADLLVQAKLLIEDGIDAEEVLKSMTIHPAKALHAKKEVLALHSKCNFVVFKNKNVKNLDEILNNIFLQKLERLYGYVMGEKVKIDKQ